MSILTQAEKLAAHLRSEFWRCRWHDDLSGIQRLNSELGVNHNTVEAALCLLENEKVVASQGDGGQGRCARPSSPEAIVPCG